MAEEEKVEAIETEETKKKKNLIEWGKEHPKTVFTTRFILWAAFAAVLPFAFIAWRYDIFTTESKIRLTGWGFVAVIILIVFVSTLIKYVYKGLKPGLAKQCIFGFVSIVLPLVILYLLISSIEDSIRLFKQALGCTILCEAVGIPLNPFPAWLAKRAKEDKTQEAKTMSDIFWDKFFEKKDKDGE